jgi:hypothetical protein
MVNFMKYFSGRVFLLSMIFITAFLSVFFISCNRAEYDPSSYILSRYGAVFTKPPDRIPSNVSVDAPMMGNGFTGVAIAGKPEKQTYYLARNDFWRLKSSYNESFPAVLGKIEIDIPGLSEASYLVEQDLYNAKTISHFDTENQETEFRSFVAAEEDIMFILITTTGETGLNGNVCLLLPGKSELDERHTFPAITESGNSENGISWIARGFEEEIDIPSKAACALKIINGKSGSFTVTKEKPVLIAAAFSSSFKSKDCLEDVKSRISVIKEEDVAVVEKKHEEWWHNYWSQSFVETGDSLLDRFYYLSNYTLASFSRDRDFPPGIFGTCVTKEIPAWSGDYHLNYNFVAPFYGLFSSNHIEQAIPCNITLLAQQPRGEYYSEKVCGISGGILLPVGAGPLGIETTRKNDYMEKNHSGWTTSGNIEDEGLFWGQKSNSAYSIVNMARHFYTTYDREYAKLYFPFVKGVAGFWEDYLRLEEGRYVIYNDAIHEGTTGTMNGILSLGLVRLVMQTAIDMSRELGEDTLKIAKWRDILGNISDFPIQEREGLRVFRYSEKGTNWWGDNTLGIQHIYPAGQIGLDSDPCLLETARNTIKVMRRWKDFNGTNSFFPAAVRVGYDPDTILNYLRLYTLNTYPNGFQRDNPHGIENCSTVPNTINEMLCQGHGGILRIFPVWPSGRDARFGNIRVDGAFLVSAEKKNGKLLPVRIVSEKGKTCRLVNPWPGKGVLIESTLNGTRELEGSMLVFETQPEEELIIKKNYCVL